MVLHCRTCHQSRQRLLPVSGRSQVTSGCEANDQLLTNFKFYFWAVSQFQFVRHLINTSLQRGEEGPQRWRNRFDGLGHKPLKRLAQNPVLTNTSLKRGVNEISN